MEVWRKRETTVSAKARTKVRWEGDGVEGGRGNNKGIKGESKT